MSGGRAALGLHLLAVIFALLCYYRSAGVRLSVKNEKRFQGVEENEDALFASGGKPPTRHYVGLHAKTWDNALIYDVDENSDVETETLRQGLKERYPERVVDLIVLDGQSLDFQPPYLTGFVQVTVDGVDFGQAIEIKEQAVDLLHSQKSESGLPGTKQFLRHRLTKALRVILVMFKSEESWRVQAIAALKEKEFPSATWCEAGYIAVAPAAQGKGVGTTLWLTLRAEAKALNLQAMFTETVITNQPSLWMQRHNSMASFLIGLFTEKFVDPTYPDRPPLQILAMLFPLQRRLLEEKTDLDRMMREVVELYKAKLVDREIMQWFENEPTVQGSGGGFLSHKYVRDVVYEDPIVDKNYEKLLQKLAMTLTARAQNRSDTISVLPSILRGKETLREPKEDGQTSEIHEFKDSVAEKICSELGIGQSAVLGAR